MNPTATTLEPTLPTLETGEQAVSYDAWFRARVQEALDEPQEYLPHDAAMAEVDRMLSQKRAQHAAG